MENNEDFSKGPNPQSIRWSHYYYLMLTLLSGYFALHYQFRRLGNPNTYVRGRLNPVQGQDFHVQAATKVWLLFAVTSHIDMYIFRQSGCIRLLPHIIHHAARVALYYMMFIFPGSPGRDGQRQLDLTIIIFGLVLPFDVWPWKRHR